MAEPVVIIDESGEPNPYLRGVYTPAREEITAENLKVIGEIPKDLNGAYLRNGPNARFPMKGRYHWFDGDGMVHAVHFEDGRARYRNRYVRTRAFEAEPAAGRSLWTGVMENPKGNPAGNTRGLNLKDSANTDLVFHRGRVLATWYLCGAPYGLVRYDNVTGAKETYHYGEHRYGSEAPFTPREGSTAEDDGHLVSFVTDEREGTSEVQVLHAADLAAGPLARIVLPRRVPLGFHATWVRTDQLRGGAATPPSPVG
ncbi:carotenoid oxygenase family protein [Streptosporangium sp. NPDC003464]